MSRRGAAGQPARTTDRPRPAAGGARGRDGRRRIRCVRPVQRAGAPPVSAGRRRARACRRAHGAGVPPPPLPHYCPTSPRPPAESNATLPEYRAAAMAAAEGRARPGVLLEREWRSERFMCA